MHFMDLIFVLLIKRFSQKRIPCGGILKGLNEIVDDDDDVKLHHMLHSNEAHFNLDFFLLFLIYLSFVKSLCSFFNLNFQRSGKSLVKMKIIIFRV